MSKPEEKETFNERINNFVQQNRKPIFVSAGIVFLGLLGFVITTFVVGEMRKTAIETVEEFNKRYEALEPLDYAGEAEGSLPDSADDVETVSEEEVLLAEVEAFAKKTGGYAGGRAWAIVASINVEKNNWTAAETAWINAAGTAKRTYLAPIAWFNAGAAAEEQGKNSEAVTYYTNSLASPVTFPAAAQARFFIGRLKEEMGDNTGALEAYRQLVSDWPDDATWTNLAHSRIILLDDGSQPAFTEAEVSAEN